MIGIQLRKMVLLSLILSISIVPMMCKFVEDAEDIQGFTRFSRSRTELEEDTDSSRNERALCAYQACSPGKHATCKAVGCGSCDATGMCTD
ncbi:uncharacterized protein MELLADRAFT_124254 [Melampsora larici-populina 98AG31]|uniref:Secreted protein n=1 Tax=Melampsora larici-populina (strain 98AG31 / pathotype 3-4-7) TaxID=747676 RepID=F4RXU3_MELLP|nr:uncharacterized protein MELLADRAFT_124254 [Melampsora larici-populina 98AG31]EGG02839.1 secreted protein [Melampsora larici-populina 98AG31]